MYWIQSILIRLLFLMGGNKMIFVTIFVSLIVAKRRNIEDVPEHLTVDVLADLEAMGLDGYGNHLIIEEEI
mgnify:CR=1 FL=1